MRSRRQIGGIEGDLFVCGVSNGRRLHGGVSGLGSQGPSSLCGNVTGKACYEIIES